jgi:hypothetical protein
MFVQAENDDDLEPGRAKPFKLLVLPPFGTSAQQGHERCVRGAHLWAAEVLAFLRGSMGPGRPGALAAPPASGRPAGRSASLRRSALVTAAR